MKNKAASDLAKLSHEKRDKQAYRSYKKGGDTSWEKRKLSTPPAYFKLIRKYGKDWRKHVNELDETIHELS